MKKFWKKNNGIMLEIPMNGTMLQMNEAPDPVFAEKMMGDGFCIDPEDGNLYSPVDGQVATLFPTNHCIGIKGTDGYEYLIHIGMDTVKLNGEGFKGCVEIGDSITKGELLIEFDLESVREKVPSIITVFAITNLGEKTIKVPNHNRVSIGEALEIIVK